MAGLKDTRDDRPHAVSVYDRKIPGQTLLAGKRYYAGCQCGWMGKWTDDHSEAHRDHDEHVRHINELPYVISANSFRAPAAIGPGLVSHRVTVTAHAYGTDLACVCGWRMLVLLRSAERVAEDPQNPALGIAERHDGLDHSGDLTWRSDTEA